MKSLTVSVSPAERRRVREFAELLEQSRPAAGHELESLVALAATVRPANLVPRAEFRTALRETLVAEAAARPVVAPAPASPAPRRHRVRTAVAGAVAVSLVGGIGAAAASTQALPGDALYGLKRTIESAQLTLAHSDLSRGRELLDQADHRLSEAESLAASEDAGSPETTARIVAAITDLNAATRAGAKAFDASYASTGDLAPLVELDRFVVDQRERLADLSALLSPELRALLAPLTQLLVALQTRLDTLVDPGASATGSPGARGIYPLTLPSVGATDGVTGGTPTIAGRGVGTGSAGQLGNGAGTSTVPTAVPHVSLVPTPLPSVAVPSVPRPSASAPRVPVPSVPAPSDPVPSVPVPSVSVPSVPVPTPGVTAPCVPVPPLTAC